jgi:hypothetical protein
VREIIQSSLVGPIVQKTQDVSVDVSNLQSKIINLGIQLEKEKASLQGLPKSAQDEQQRRRLEWNQNHSQIEWYKDKFFGKDFKTYYFLFGNTFFVWGSTRDKAESRYRQRENNEPKLDKESGLYTDVIEIKAGDNGGSCSTLTQSSCVTIQVRKGSKIETLHFAFQSLEIKNKFMLCMLSAEQFQSVFQKSKTSKIEKIQNELETSKNELEQLMALENQSARRSVGMRGVRGNITDTTDIIQKINEFSGLMANDLIEKAMTTMKRGGSLEVALSDLIQSIESAGKLFQMCSESTKDYFEENLLELLKIYINRQSTDDREVYAKVFEAIFRGLKTQAIVAVPSLSDVDVDSGDEDEDVLAAVKQKTGAAAAAAPEKSLSSSAALKPTSRPLLARAIGAVFDDGSDDEEEEEDEGDDDDEEEDEGDEDEQPRPRSQAPQPRLQASQPQAANLGTRAQTDQATSGLRLRRPSALSPQQFSSPPQQFSSPVVDVSSSRQSRQLSQPRLASKVQESPASSAAALQFTGFDQEDPVYSRLQSPPAIPVQSPSPDSARPVAAATQQSQGSWWNLSDYTVVKGVKSLLGRGQGGNRKRTRRYKKMNALTKKRIQKYKKKYTRVKRHHSRRK